MLDGCCYLQTDHSNFTPPLFTRTSHYVHCVGLNHVGGYWVLSKLQEKKEIPSWNKTEHFRNIHECITPVLWNIAALHMRNSNEDRRSLSHLPSNTSSISIANEERFSEFQLSYKIFSLSTICGHFVFWGFFFPTSETKH